MELKAILLLAVGVFGVSSQAYAQIRVMTPAEIAAHNKATGRITGDAPRTLKLGAKAPYASVLVDLAEDIRYCGKQGCKTGIFGVDRAGKRHDLTPTVGPIRTDTDPSIVVFGAIDVGGMPRILLNEQVGDHGRRAEYAYDRAKLRYAFVRARPFTGQ
ncbi:hypothetical protein [Sphingomonas adhaesiva]|uniref:hypothetical protein n=1 Tax=Sphingomonas adhaesiva TaxID=28212 RepID=UPI002FF62797